jgi:hypothetical protein
MRIAEEIVRLVELAAKVPIAIHGRHGAASRRAASVAHTGVGGSNTGTGHEAFTETLKIFLDAVWMPRTAW